MTSIFKKMGSSIKQIVVDANSKIKDGHTELDQDSLKQIIDIARSSYDMNSIL